MRPAASPNLEIALLFLRFCSLHDAKPSPQSGTPLLISACLTLFEKKCDMKIGIPKALLYFKYAHLWESFFETLGIEFVLSPDTNKDIIALGQSYAVDESCLSSKIFLGHVAWLKDKCDAVFVPRIAGYGKAGTVCTKFSAIYDLCANTFRSDSLRLVHYNIDLANQEYELNAFIKLGMSLGKKRAQSLYAYWMGKQAERSAQMIATSEQERLLETNGVKLLLVAHPYNIMDKYIGAPVRQSLQSMGAVPIIGCAAGHKATAASFKLSETVPWAFSRELLGAIALYKDRVDGIILISTFPCGPDSLVSEIIIRRVTDKPILNLILDEQDGTAGLETRLESFLDIINYKRYSNIG